MLVLKSCPKCQTGDLLVQDDLDGPSALCIQCGYRAAMVPVGVGPRGEPGDVERQAG